MEGRISRSRSICHGLTRKNTQFRAESVSDGSFLLRRTQLFIAYLYKPEAQAKVLQIHVYYSHIIPSLALQACKTRDTVKSRFSNPQLIADKRARALRQAQGPGDKYEGLNQRFKWSSCSGASPSQLLCL